MMLPQRSCCSLIRRGALLDMPSTTRCGKIAKSQHTKIITLQHRHKRTTSITKEARQAISNNNNNSSTAPEAIFGMRPINYSIVPPIRASPPPPPSKPGLQKYIAPASMVVMFATVGYFYVNNKNDNFEYWAAMQSGEAIQMEDDEDDYEDEEEEEE